MLCCKRRGRGQHKLMKDDADAFGTVKEFGRQFKANMSSEWKDHYVQYSHVKELIWQTFVRDREGERSRLILRSPVAGAPSYHSVDDDDEEAKAPTAPTSGSATPDTAAVPWNPSFDRSSGLQAAVMGVPVGAGSHRLAQRDRQAEFAAAGLPLPRDKDECEAMVRFYVVLLDQVEKADAFYRRTEYELLEEFRTLQRKRRENANKGEQSEHDLKLRRKALQHQFVLHFRRQVSLANFALLNLTALDKLLAYASTCSGAGPILRSAFTSAFLNASTMATGKPRREIRHRDTVVAYAAIFEEGDQDRAKVSLMAHMSPSQFDRGDFFRLGVKMGVVLCLAFAVACTTVRKHTETHVFFVPVYRALGLLLVWMYLWGLNVYIWDMFRINFVYIFEFDPRSRLTALQIWEEAASLSIALCLNYLAFVSAHGFKLKWLPVRIPQRAFPVALMGWFALKLLAPPSAFSGANAVFTLHKTRLSLWRGLYKTVFAPFTSARFAECYVADVLTSMVKILNDFAMGACAVGTCVVFGSHAPIEEVEPLCQGGQTVWMPLLTALPLWWRFQQNMRRYYQTGKRWPHTGNALKYAVAHSVVIVGVFHPSFGKDLVSYEMGWTRALWLASFLASTLYTFFWDVTQDWGLFASDAPPKHRFLRKNLLYQRPWVYYVAICSNFLLRFTWTLTLTPFGLTVGERSFLPLIIGLELYRRFQWGVFRLEHAHLNDTEGYRSGDSIPIFFDTQQLKNARKKNAEQGKQSLVWEILLMVALLMLVAVFGALF